MAMTLITTNTSSGAASSSFTSSIDSTYKLYIFKCINMNPATDSVEFGFQGSTDGGSNYNTTITSTSFYAIHSENDGSAALAYLTAGDQAQGTAYQRLNAELGNAADENTSGTLHLFSPSSTTYVKHFYATFPSMTADNQNFNFYTAGYFNTTSAIDAIDFKMSSGNMDAVIKMYGVG